MPVPYWRLSAFYFCYFATLGAFLPFWSVYLQTVGFAADQIGALTAMMVATKIVAPYLWGWLADKTGRGLLLIRITTLLSVLLFAGFLARQDYAWMASITVAFSFFWNLALEFRCSLSCFAALRFSAVFSPRGFLPAVIHPGAERNELF